MSPIHRIILRQSVAYLEKNTCAACELVFLLLLHRVNSCICVLYGLITFIELSGQEVAIAWCPSNSPGSAQRPQNLGSETNLKKENVASA